MSCHATHERLPDWLAGRVESAEAATVERHIEICGDCRAEADLLRATRAAFSPVALGETVEPNWAAMRQRVLRAARSEQEAPGLVERAREWFAETWRPLRLKPALAAATVVLVCAMGFSLTVGPYLFGPQRAATLASLSLDELEALSETISVEGDGDLLGAETLDAETLRELANMPPEELERLLRTL